MNAVSSLFLIAILSAPGDAAPNQLAGAGPVALLQFSSQRCQHCQAMQPVVAQLAQSGVQVHVVDVDQQLDIARQFQVNGVPTYVALRGGQETGRIEGVTDYQKLAALVQGTVVRDQRSEVTGQGAGQSAEQTARAATVRIKVEDATGYGFGTGTIIDAHDNEALVVTCGHLFRESQGKGRITADMFVAAAPQSVDGQLIAYDLERDIALVSLRVAAAVRPVRVAPPGHMVRPGDRVFTIGCDKGAEPSVRPTHITAVNKYRGKPNFTAAGQPIDGRSGGGLFTSDGHLIGICNAADPADDEGLYAGLASIHWQLDKIGQSEIYQRAARGVAATDGHRDAGVALASAQSRSAPPPVPPQLAPQMPAGPLGGIPATVPIREVANVRQSLPGNESAPVAATGDDTEIVFIVRFKRNPAQQSEVYVVDQATPDLIASITHAARSSGERRAEIARANPRPAPLTRDSVAWNAASRSRPDLRILGVIIGSGGPFGTIVDVA